MRSRMTGTQGGDGALPGDVDVEGLAAEIAALIVTAGVPFHRGEPTSYFRRLSRLHVGLTLPIVPPSRARDAVFLKLLYSLWNIVVDDQIDRSGDASEVDASIVFLSGLEAEERHRRTPAGIILGRMAEIVPSGKIGRLDALGFDLWEVVNGLCYEHLINKSPSHATVAEYRRYSTMTASVKVLLDIDLSLAASPLDRKTCRALREAYDEATLALKLASDIGTLEREIHDEDNLSLLRILSEADAAPASPQRRDELVSEALRFKDSVLGLSREHWARAVSLFEGVSRVDTSGVVRALRWIIESYSGGADPFFEGPRSAPAPSGAQPG